MYVLICIRMIRKKCYHSENVGYGALDCFRLTIDQVQMPVKAKAYPTILDCNRMYCSQKLIISLGKIMFYFSIIIFVIHIHFFIFVTNGVTLRLLLYLPL